MDRRAGRGVVERPQHAVLAPVEETDELGTPAARARRMDAGELALDLAGEEHGSAQEARVR